MKNDVYEGDESGPIALPGSHFVSDPFDHTVTVVKPDGSGTQYTYVAEETSDGPRMRLEHTEVLSPIRVKALAFMDQRQGTFQEEATGPADRQNTDRLKGEEKRKIWADESPANRAALDAYNSALRKYSDDIESHKKALTKDKTDKPPTPPAPPKGMPALRRTTLCNGFPPIMTGSIVGDGAGLGGLDPAVEGEKRGSWRTLETQPEGPRPGDIYSLGAAHDKREIKHVGIFKSSRPGPRDTRIWTVVDGGQGTYETRQQILERTRYYDPKTQLLSTGLADAGQSPDDRSLRGWIDIDEHLKKPDAPP